MKLQIFEKGECAVGTQEVLTARGHHNNCNDPDIWVRFIARQKSEGGGGGGERKRRWVFKKV